MRLRRHRPASPSPSSAPLTLVAGAQRLPSRLGGPVGPPPKPGATAPAPGKPGAPAPTAPARPSGPEKVVPFRPGESLTYDVSWSDYLTAGSATLTVRDKRPSFGSTAYYLIAEGRPTTLLSKLYAVYYKVDSLVDAYTLFPQRGSVFSQENGRQRMKETRFEQAKRTATFQMRTSTTMTQDQTLPGPTHDGLSALTAMRTLTFAPGVEQLVRGLRLRLPLSRHAERRREGNHHDRPRCGGGAGRSSRRSATARDSRSAADSRCGSPTTRDGCRCASRRRCRSARSC